MYCTLVLLLPQVTVPYSYGVAGSGKTLFIAKSMWRGWWAPLSRGASMIACYCTATAQGKEEGRVLRWILCDGYSQLQQEKCTLGGGPNQLRKGIAGSRKSKVLNMPWTRIVSDDDKNIADQACSEKPSYSVQGSRKRCFSAEHTGTGIVVIIKKRCAREGCLKYSKFGVLAAGSWKTKFCRPDRMPQDILLRKIYRVSHGWRHDVPKGQCNAFL